MFFIPTRLSFEIHVDGKQNEVREALGAKVSQRLLSPFPHNVFVGYIDEAGFDLKESVWYPRTYNPGFRGSFHMTSDGLAVGVTVSNAYATFNVVTGWLVAALVSGLAFTQVLEGDLIRAAGLACVSVTFAVISALIGRLYHRKLQDGKQKLLRILLP